MKKILKKIASLVMALAIVLGVFASISVFAENSNVPSQYEEIDGKIKGSIDLSKTVKSEGVEVSKDGKLYYEGTVSGSVEASDLFGRPYENLVMFDKGQKFPTAKYTVYFPSDFEVKLDKITFSENTATISKIEKSYNKKNNSVTFTFNLGNWNDYKGFFDLYETEKGLGGHPITINIPYSVEIKDSTTSNLGRISADGKCELFYKKLFFQTQIVDITASEISLDIVR